MIQKIKPRILIPFNLVLQFIDKLWHDKYDVQYLDMFPPTFIVGPPRSGTTVLYQLLCKHLQFGYINNFVANWPKAPLTASIFYKKFYQKSHDIELVSNYGISPNTFGPNEFGRFWYRWFDKNNKLISTQKQFLNKLKIEISGLTNIHQRPLLFKNVMHSMRILDLYKIFNNSTFIVLKRNKIDIAQSILKAKIDLYKNKNHSFSVISSKEQLDPNLPYWKKIPSQINGVYSNIEEAKNLIGRNNFIFVDYKELCLNTEKVLKDIETNYKIKGQNIYLDKNISINNLNYSTGIKVNKHDYDLLKNEINDNE